MVTQVIACRLAISHADFRGMSGSLDAEVNSASNDVKVEFVGYDNSSPAVIYALN